MADTEVESKKRSEPSFVREFDISDTDESDHKRSKTNDDAVDTENAAVASPVSPPNVLRLHKMENLLMAHWIVHPEDVERLDCGGHDSSSISYEVPGSNPFRLHPSIQANRELLENASSTNYVHGATKFTGLEITCDAGEDWIGDSKVFVTLHGHVQDQNNDDDGYLDEGSVRCTFHLKNWSAELHAVQN